MRKSFPDLDIHQFGSGNKTTYRATGPKADCEAWFEQLCGDYPPQGYGTKSEGPKLTSATRWTITATRWNSCD